MHSGCCPPATLHNELLISMHIVATLLAGTARTSRSSKSSRGGNGGRVCSYAGEASGDSRPAASCCLAAGLPLHPLQKLSCSRHCLFKLLIVYPRLGLESTKYHAARLQSCFVANMLGLDLQEEQQLGKTVDIGGAVNIMVMHLARANLAGAIKQIAVTAMSMQQKLDADASQRALEQNRR